MELLEGERETILSEVENTLQDKEKTRENLIPILQQVQKKLGYLPGLAMEKIGEALGIPAVDVFGLATFYDQFRLNPPGEHEIKVCMGTACYMTGGRIALDSFKRKLEINEGETTSDRKYSLERVACVGCCTMAPVVVVDERIEGHVTATRVDGLMLELQGEAGKEDHAEEEREEEQEGEEREEIQEEGEQEQ